MLTKLAIFNSKKHTKIVLKLDDATAIQIIGENKIGKTTLIDSLNFLYIIDKNKMSFDSRGGKSTYDFKESLYHFFPELNQSFIVFECFKAKAGGYFCILVKRKAGVDDVEYFKIDKKFDENDYIEANGNLKKFTDIRQNLMLSNKIEFLKERTDFFQWVYGKDTNKNAFLWINDKVKRKGQSIENSLTKTYRFLLNAKSIDDSALGEALMIADNRQSEQLNVFTDKNKIQSVDNLNKENAYIKKLEIIKPQFEEFKLLVGKVNIKKKNLNDLLYSFDKKLKEQIVLLKNNISQADINIGLHKQEIAVIKPKYDVLSDEITDLKAQILILVNTKNPEKGRIYQKEQVLLKTADIEN